MPLPAIAAAIPVIAKGVKTAVGYIQGRSDRKRQEKQYREQFDFAQSQFDYQKDINQWAMDMQEKQFGMEQERMAREDNAMQRRVVDLQQAGLNKNLAIMQGGAGAQAGGNVGGMRMSANAGTAPNRVEMSPMEQAFMGAQMGKLFSEIDVDKAHAKLMDRQAENIGERLDLDERALKLQERITNVSEGELSQLILSNQIKADEIDKWVEIEGAKLQEAIRSLNYDMEKFNEERSLRQSREQLEKAEAALKTAQERLTSSQADLHERDYQIISQSSFTSQQWTSSDASLLATKIEQLLISIFGSPYK